MVLVTAATDFEMQPFASACRLDGVSRLVTGIGPVETAVNLFSRLSCSDGEIGAVINFGVAGAYIQETGDKSPQILDICLAEKEIFGDLGICLDDRIERIAGPGLSTPVSFPMDPRLLAQAEQALTAGNISCFRGNFVTVGCASGTAGRGRMLARLYRGMCENMEGAAVARVCREFGLPCIELRCISNLVEDRDRSRWRLRDACAKAAEAAALVAAHIVGAGHVQ
ncbi:MAG TPA: futalosine hydrolase [Desulfobacteraceae bacterium]|nr:futalosine hydrolase [Desulfobacteraceae bacterium]